MQKLSSFDIESELSYAYLHAVASRAGMGCVVSNRHADNNGIDARLTAWGNFADNAYLTEVDINVQLKATIGDPGSDSKYLSFFFKGIKQYDDLRAETVGIPRILVVLFLPSVAEQWLVGSPDALLIRRCAYWVSLRRATKSENDTGVTIYIPRSQTFTCDNLSKLVTELAQRKIPNYVAP